MIKKKTLDKKNSFQGSLYSNLKSNSAIYSQPDDHDISLFSQEETQIAFLKAYNLIHSNVLNTDSKSQNIIADVDQTNQPLRLKLSISTNSSIKTQSQHSQKSKISNSKQKSLELDDFILGKLMGTGRFSEVFAAKHKKTGFVVALKKISIAKILQEKMLEQLIREIKIQYYCNHPNLTKLYGFFVTKNHFYLITELAADGQLYNQIQRRKLNIRFNKPCFEQKEVAQYMKQVVQGVKYLHSLHIIHRDLKPENILYDRGVLKICDFGWAVNLKTDLRSTFCGTPLYVSPEVLKGEKYDQKVDIWAIGIITYQLFYGDIPFQIESNLDLGKIIKDDVVFPKLPEVSREFKDFILKALEKDAKQRTGKRQFFEHPFLGRN